jgi:hypothetical protein
MFDTLRAAVAPRELETRWSAMRRRPREADRCATGTTRQWVRRLPARRRPLALCALYPHVANRLAWVWPEPGLSTQLLDELLQDRRGGRRGFPASVVRELQRLREFNAQQRVEVRPESLWSAIGRVTHAW